VSNNIIDSMWHQHFYEKQLFQVTSWRGVSMLKLPLDVCIYQEILWEVKPRVLVEAGTWVGGSATFFADMATGCRVITIDTVDQVQEIDPRVDYLRGSSLDGWVVAQIGRACLGVAPVMVVLDSDHDADHVFAEMQAYAPMVTQGSYMVVEDSNIGGHPVNSGPPGSGPWAAIERFLQEHPGEFEQDRSREKYGVTFNPGGWLRRIGEKV
jgi:cephalosporin hydroxylase